MRKQLSKVIITNLLVIIVYLLIVSTHNVKAASIENEMEGFELEEATTNVSLDTILREEDEIMKYDVKTGKTTKVDIEELRKLVTYSNEEESDRCLSYYDPFERAYQSRILGNSSRIAIYRYIDTSNFRNRVVCKTTNTEGANGTATLVGPKIVLTAAHAVFNSSTKQKYTNWTCWPGYSNGAYQGNQDYKCGYSELYYSRTWINGEGNDSNYDWALCVLQKNLGDMLGWTRT